MLQKFSNQYDVYDVLGKGAFGTVSRCVKKTTGQEFAVKIINTNLSKIDLEDTLYEVEICRKLQHKNVVRLFESFDEKDKLYLVFDLVVGGELMHDIEKRKFYSELDASKCMQKILEAIKYCHGKGIVHRDLKPENILLASKARGAEIKIADFGLAVEVSGDEHHRFGYAGTLDYMAPEVIKEKAYGKPVDLWSCGVILYILLTGDPPFKCKHNDELEKKILSGVFDYPSDRKTDISKDAKNFVKQMLTMNSYDRITAAETLRHPWICQRDAVAPKIHLNKTIVHLKKFNARRKFKAAIHAAMAAKRFLKKSPTNILKKYAIVERDNRNGTQIKTGTILRKNLKRDIIKLTEELINACGIGDWRTVEKLCDPRITTFDSTRSGDIVEGIDFHNSISDNIPVGSYIESNTIIENPYVHLFGEETACIAYVRSTEYSSRSGSVYLVECEETRIWHNRDGKWKNVHFHRGLTFDDYQ